MYKTKFREIVNNLLKTTHKKTITSPNFIRILSLGFGLQFLCRHPKKTSYFLSLVINKLC